MKRISILEPGTIIGANYAGYKKNEDGTIVPDSRSGVFLVLYDQQLDNSNIYTRNIRVCKCTTDLKLCDNYTVALKDGRNDFLDKDCFALCSCVMTLHKDQVYNTEIGRIDPVTLKKVYLKTVDADFAVEKQLGGYI